MSFLLLFAFADVARRAGYRVERKLGTRATPELWYRSNSMMPNATKDLYRSFVSSQIKRAAPSEADELERPAEANDFYLGAGDWLRAQTRDTKKFHILFNELIIYGFRRNLLGLKPIAFAMNAVVVAGVAAIMWFRPSYFQTIVHRDDALYVILVVVVVHSAYMAIAVTKASVREASMAYGKQLIESCGLLISASKPKATASQRR